MVPCRKNNGRQDVKIPQMNPIVQEQQKTSISEERQTTESMGLK